MAIRVGTGVPRGRRWALRPGWPLTAVLVGYPLWWLLGVAEIVPLVAAVLMIRELHKRRKVPVQAGFGIWLTFLAWVVVGVLLLQVNAPGAVPQTSMTRYFTFSFRLAWYLAATVSLLYVFAMRDRLSTQRITRAAGWLFVTVVVGGLVGTVAPHLEFRSAVELMLPHHLVNVQFVHDMVHPVVAQLYTVDGAERPRASAPFAYTNDWGLNFGCLLPFFLVGWLRRGAGWHRPVGILVLLAGVYPVIRSENRGLWLALIVCGLVLGVRAAFLGHVRILAGLIGAGIVGAVVLLATPLGTAVQARLGNGYSDRTRSTLGSMSVSSVMAGSPVVGFGTTRNVQGSFYSIAGGDTSSCSICTPPALGTQGHFWLVIYSTGLGGLLCYLGFVLLQFFRHLSIHAPPVTLGLSVITIHLATMFVYDTIGIALVLIFVAIGLMWRERAAGGAPGPPATLAGYAAFLRRNTTAILVCTLAGVVGGVAYQHHQGIPATSTTTVLAPLDPVYVSSPSRPQTLDTIAALVDAPGVLDQVSTAAGRTVSPGDPALWVTATANTRLLQVHFSDRNAAVSANTAEAAARALIAERTTLLDQQRDRVVKALQQQQSALLDAISAIDHTSAAQARRSAERRALVARANDTNRLLTQVESAQLSGGSITDHATTSYATDRWLVAACSGAMLGLLAGLILAMVRRLSGSRVGARRRHGHFGGLPVLARVKPGQTLAAGLPAAELLSAGRDPGARTWAHDMSDARGHATPDIAEASRRRPAAVVVAGAQDTDIDVDRLCRQLEVSGVPVQGLVIVGRAQSAPRPENRLTLSRG